MDNIIEVNGLKFEIHNKTNTYDINGVVKNNEYSIFPEDFKNIKTIIDIGGSIGTFCIMASPYVEKILSFEPEPKNFEFLEKNIKLNNISNIIAINKAVSTQTGKEKFYISRASSNRHTLENIRFTYTKKILEINCIGINDIFKEYEFNYPCMLKMDIEGGEYKIIPVLTQENLNKINIFILEAHEYPDKPEWSHSILENLLISQNYKIITKKLGSTKDYCGWAIKGIK